MDEDGEEVGLKQVTDPIYAPISGRFCSFPCSIQVGYEFIDCHLSWVRSAERLFWLPSMAAIPIYKCFRYFVIKFLNKNLMQCNS